MARRPEAIIFVDDPQYPTGSTLQPEPHFLVGPLPQAALTAAGPETAGAVKQAAHVDPTAGTVAEIVASLVAAGIMAAA